MYKFYENESLAPKSASNMRQMQVEILFVLCLVYFDLSLYPFSVQHCLFYNCLSNWKIKNIKAIPNYL